ncbi:hypothetical protein [Phenylobacterium sp.]|jgi:hypothetical protein
MRYWKLLIVLSSGAAAVAVGLSSRTPMPSLLADMVSSVLAGIT